MGMYTALKRNRLEVYSEIGSTMSPYALWRLELLSSYASVWPNGKAVRAPVNWSHSACSIEVDLEECWS